MTLNVMFVSHGAGAWKSNTGSRAMLPAEDPALSLPASRGSTVP